MKPDAPRRVEGHVLTGPEYARQGEKFPGLQVPPHTPTGAGRAPRALSPSVGPFQEGAEGRPVSQA